MSWDRRLGKSPKKLAEDLEKIFYQKFGGKSKGRFRTSRGNFRKLAGLPVLDERYLREVSLWLRKTDMILVDCDSFFIIFPISNTKSFRRVPTEVLEEYLEMESEGDEVDEEE